MAKTIQAFEAKDGSLHKTASDADRNDTYYSLCDTLSSFACIDDGSVKGIVTTLLQKYDIKPRSK